MSSGRKTPHCKTCHKPRKGHKRGACDLNDMRSYSTDDPHLYATTPNSSPLRRLPTLSTESSQILNDILLANSRPAGLICSPGVKGVASKKSSRWAYKSLREALDTLPADNVNGLKPGEETSLSLKRNKSSELPGAETKSSLPLGESKTKSLSLSKPCVVSQQLLVKASSKGPNLEPLMITMSQITLNDSTCGETCKSPQEFSASDIPSAELTIQHFLDGMARNQELPPSTILSYPVDNMASLEEIVKSHGLRMHVLSLPKEKWVPVVIGRSTDAITKLLEDGEKLTQSMRRVDEVKAHKFDLRMSHVVVGALGALATWAGLAYS